MVRVSSNAILINSKYSYLFWSTSRRWAGFGEFSLQPVKTRARFFQLLWDRQRTRVLRGSRGPRTSLLSRGRAAGCGVSRPTAGEEAQHCFRATLLRGVLSDEEGWCGARRGSKICSRGRSVGGLLGAPLRHDATHANASQPNMIMRNNLILKDCFLN